MKLIKIALLVLIPGFIFAGKSKIEFVKQKLIVTPQEQATTKNKIAIKLIPALAIPPLQNYWFLRKVAPPFARGFFDGMKQWPMLSGADEQGMLEKHKQNALCIINVTKNQVTSIFRASLIYYVIHKIIFNKLEKAQLLTFLKEWEFNKKYTPKRLHYLFEELQQNYLQKKSLDVKKVKELRARISKIITEASKSKKHKLKRIINETDELNWKTFIAQFTNTSKNQKLKNTAMSLISSLGLGALFWAYISDRLGAISTQKFNLITVPANNETMLIPESGFFYSKFRLFLTAIPSIFASRYIFRKVNGWLILKEQEKTIKHFVENWEEIKQKTPAKLYDLLENTHSKYKENPKQVDFAECTRIVQGFVNNRIAS